MCYDYTSHSPMLTVTLLAFTKIGKCLLTCNEFIKSIGLQANLKLKVLLLHLHNSMVPNERFPLKEWEFFIPPRSSFVET